MPLREDDVASLKVQLVYLVIGFGLWWCIKVRCGGLIGVAESFGGHGKSVRRCVQIRGQALDLNTVWILPPFSSIQCELISQFSLFSMYENRGRTSDLNIFVPRRNDTKNGYFFGEIFGNPKLNIGNYKNTRLNFLTVFFGD